MAPKAQEEMPNRVTTLTEQVKAEELPLVWTNVTIFIFLHATALLGLYVGVTQPTWQGWVLAVVSCFLSCLGTTAGAHRLWSHKAYSAKLPLRIFLMLLFSLAGQNDIYEWSRDHRVHHKFSETNADPHDINRGLFFAHMGWLMRRKHPNVIKKGKTVDCSDLLEDPVVRFQRRFYVPLAFLCGFIIPTLIPVLCWGERVWFAFVTNGVARYVVSLHLTWLINSIAHWRGNKPYNRFLTAVESANITWWALGEGFHNFHHSFPNHYAASEYGWKHNFTKMFIDIMAKLGQAYNLKTVPDEVIEKTRRKSGDGTTTFGPSVEELRKQC
ncbi:delta(9)-fatty-acid desaturase fat-6-like [Limulus polyphemus]|uniref:Delta(9)-fatty-acid desaturase fat-6-like n=1 Tax=Limulus polyphemus TaxID=6850 RepID=A0ABM1BX73_LIMPO|nr:delta(9)-fatty-acid desaturase fat-6-like [Limulus polyphemus]XP_013790387.1 delta(9)-fatty-acid desaturase fat-6-like [Limulus polyphemus]